MFNFRCKKISSTFLFISVRDGRLVFSEQPFLDSACFEDQINLQGSLAVVGSVSEPEYVHRRTADQPTWAGGGPERAGGPERGGAPRPRLGKEAAEHEEDVVYGQVLQISQHFLR